MLIEVNKEYIIFLSTWFNESTKLIKPFLFQIDLMFLGYKNNKKSFQKNT